VEIGALQDRLSVYLGYLHVKAAPDHSIAVIPNNRYTEQDHQWIGYGKCGDLRFGGKNIRTSANYTLDKHRTVIGNRIR